MTLQELMRVLTGETLTGETQAPPVIGELGRLPTWIRLGDDVLVLESHDFRPASASRIAQVHLRFAVFHDESRTTASRAIDLTGVRLTDPGGDTTAAAMLALAVLAGRRDALPALIDEVKAVYDIP